MANNRILRFHAPDKVFHSVNAITWFALLFTGVYVYFCEPEAACAEATMLAHLILGVVFTFNLLGFIVLAPDRFALILRACLEWDRNTIFWFRNFGGYPRRFFKIPFGPVEVPPQGRYNGGQKASYLLFMGMIAALTVTGGCSGSVLRSSARPCSSGRSTSMSGVPSSSPCWSSAPTSRLLCSPWSTSRASGASARAPSLLKLLNITLRSGSNVTSSAPTLKSKNHADRLICNVI